MEVKIECRQPAGSEMPEFVELALRTVSEAAAECQTDEDWRALTACVAMAGVAITEHVSDRVAEACLVAADEVFGDKSAFASIADICSRVLSMAWAIKASFEGTSSGDGIKSGKRDLAEAAKILAGEKMSIVDARGVLVRCLRRAADVAESAVFSGVAK